MDVLRLRTLTYKSILGFGKYADFTVKHILDLNHTRYLRWVYYNCDMISFTDEILDRIYVIKELRIEKPGKNPELGKKIDNNITAKLDDMQVLKNLMHARKVRKKINSSNEASFINKNSKRKLQAINHGKMRRK